MYKFLKMSYYSCNDFNFWGGERNKIIEWSII